MKKIYSLLLVPISILSFTQFNVNSEEIKSKKGLISLNQNNLNNNLVLSTDSSDDKNVDIFLNGIGDNPQIDKTIQKDLITIKIKSNHFEDFNDFQSLSLPSVGIKTLTLSGKEDTIKIVIKPLEEITVNEPNIAVQNNSLKLTFPKQDIKFNNFTEDNIFSIKPIQKAENISKISNKAIAPPLGDISVGTTYIPNLKTVNLEGPNVSMVFKGATAKSAIEFLISKTNYGYVWVQKDPTFQSDINKNSSNSSNINDLNLQNNEGAENEEEKVSDSPRYITLTIKDKPFSVAFNSILMSSGLEAKLENGIVYVGPDVQDRIFSERISRIYRLNQTTANAAASYLANLGAKVTQTNTITTAVTSGASQSQAVTGGASSATTTEQSTTSVRSYGGNEGPLLGLIATTDDRLQTITLIGTPDLIKVAETYIKQLDLRQRQVALTVRILDVMISDGTTLDNSWAFRQNNKFIVNASGKLMGSINSIVPPTESNFGSAAVNNNSSTFPQQTFIDLLKADIASKDTKVIANPTLILNEFPGSTGGDTVTFSSVNDTLKAGTIGRSYGNEAFVIVGTQVPINCTFDAESGVATLEYGIAGLTFGARISRIDDNGYVTFSISPAISTKSEQRTISNCATVDLLATRRLDSGAIRVKDGNTLILTGVLDSTENETVSKWPILGDLPLLGQIFRKTVSSKEQRELVILVTPQILNSLEPLSSDVGYNPQSEDTKDFLEGNINN
tara:strand:+ start:3706 stop:5901 length:2196 start_codon:yes stop_codon:yes gene_type:complete